MPGRKRPASVIQGAREAAAIAANLGGQARTERLGLRRTQAQLSVAVGLSRSRYGEVERGEGASLPLDTWVAIGLAIGRPLAVGFSRPVHAAAPADAAHLAMQELILRLATESGRRATFELPTRPADPWRSTDVGIRDDRTRTLILVECWNTFGDVGAARRATTRKVNEAEALAVALGGERPYRVLSVWVVRSTAANRSLVRSYPEVFASACPGSSQGWEKALTSGSPPPRQTGFVWCDPAAGRIWPRRRPS